MFTCRVKDRKSVFRRFKSAPAQWNKRFLPPPQRHRAFYRLVFCSQKRPRFSKSGQGTASVTRYNAFGNSGYFEKLKWAVQFNNSSRHKLLNRRAMYSISSWKFCRTRDFLQSQRGPKQTHPLQKARTYSTKTSIDPVSAWPRWSAAPSECCWSNPHAPGGKDYCAA